MSERSEYQPGVPCWVDTLQADPQAAMRFYSELFGWEFVGSSEYAVARIRGRDVAGVGSEPAAGAPQGPAWNTYVAVTSVADAVDRAAGAGGVVLAGPVDASPAGRLAIISDPTGAVFGLWEPELRRGAQLVNEPSAWAMSLLHTGAPARAQAFYAGLFGWEYEAFGMEGAQPTLCRLPGYVGGEPEQPVPRDVVAVLVPITPDDASRQAKSRWSVDFWIADVDAAAAKTPGLGGSVLVAAHDTPGFRSAALADPGGAAFSVSTLKVGP